MINVTETRVSSTLSTLFFTITDEEGHVESYELTSHNGGVPEMYNLRDGIFMFVGAFRLSPAMLPNEVAVQQAWVNAFERGAA